MSFHKFGKAFFYFLKINDIDSKFIMSIIIIYFVFYLK
ncbi:hypothetical protein HMPREF9246_1996 [Anaerococcus hydrogenalis ACS-025-V-Sch4]|uniref:Uncharacterized protein n=1 Tax=Anaerococcus hydrogenalis ACS-025-V-Sch4 TaxID=879306 RepID=F0H0N8_9FIRM|nr:hypothetical protein HMPREF9246_1996 [Anaerococcus hydrogenalis ACS-025-V-Sch4]